jgi:hypothetical protein
MEKTGEKISKNNKNILYYDINFELYYTTSVP